jgi:ethanolamine transporter EutH
MLMRDLLAVKSEVQLAEHMLELDLLAICDLLSDVHLQLVLIVLKFISEYLIIFLDGFFDPLNLPIEPVDLF